LINELTVEGFTPHKKQSEVIDLCLSDDYKFVICVSGRQFGKTFLAMNLLLKWALEDNGSISMFVSPVYSQAKKVFSELINAIADTGLAISMNKSDLFITFINGSIIYFRSGEREDSLRGYTLDYLIMDEAAYQKSAVWNTVLRPTVLVKGKKVLFISTPKGRNWFNDLANRGYSNDYPNYTTYHATSFDTPFITQEELNEAKLSLPENIYRQEILAEFIDDGVTVFSNLKVSCTLSQYPKKEPADKFFAGLDVGRANDYTVLTIFNNKGEVSRIFRDRQNSWNVLVSEVVKHLREFNARCIVEINGIGDPIFEMIRKQYSNIEGFTTTNESKQNIIEELILSMNENKIRLPTPELFPDLYQEFSTFTYEYSPKTRRVKYGAPSGFHDDIVMSVALANECLKKKINYGSYVVR
jgi:hypothetical protein